MFACARVGRVVARDGDTLLISSRLALLDQPHRGTGYDAWHRLEIGSRMEFAETRVCDWRRYKFHVFGFCIHVSAGLVEILGLEKRN